MMRIVSMLLICILLLCFPGCETNPKDTFPTMPPTLPRSDRIERPFEVVLAEFYDSEYTHLPSEAEIQSITKGMTLKDVVAILGKPHNGGPTSGVPSISWRSDAGSEYFFIVMDDYTIPKPADYDEWYWFEQIMEYGYVVSGPHKMGENEE